MFSGASINSAFPSPTIQIPSTVGGENGATGVNAAELVEPAWQLKNETAIFLRLHLAENFVWVKEESTKYVTLRLAINFFVFFF